MAQRELQKKCELLGMMARRTNSMSLMFEFANGAITAQLKTLGCIGTAKKFRYWLAE